MLETLNLAEGSRSCKLFSGNEDVSVVFSVTSSNMQILHTLGIPGRYRGSEPIVFIHGHRSHSPAIILYTPSHWDQIPFYQNSSVLTPGGR